MSKHGTDRTDQGESRSFSFEGKSSCDIRKANFIASLVYGDCTEGVGLQFRSFIGFSLLVCTRDLWALPRKVVVRSLKFPQNVLQSTFPLISLSFLTPVQLHTHRGRWTPPLALEVDMEHQVRCLYSPFQCKRRVPKYRHGSFRPSGL